MRLLATVVLFFILRGLTPFFYGATWPDGLITIALGACAYALVYWIPLSKTGGR